MIENTVKRPPVFSPQERDHNEALKDQLFDLVKSNQALLFVGAGCSALAGYPTWSELITELERIAIDCDPGFQLSDEKRENYPVSYAGSIKAHIIAATGNTDRYHEAIQRLFSLPNPPSVDDFHRELVRLPFKGIITTNYDKLLEVALSEEHASSGPDCFFYISELKKRYISEFFLSLDSESYRKRILHLHGIHDEPLSIVLSSDEYQESYNLILQEETGELIGIENAWNLHRKVLWAILATRRVIFVGFSMSDPYLWFMMDLVSSDLWRWDNQIHYAIMPIDNKSKDRSILFSEKLKRELSIEAVFFENEDGSYQGLRNLITELSNATESGVQETSWMDEVSKRMIDLVETNED
jgi:hypothetical protein